MNNPLTWLMVLLGLLAVLYLIARFLPIKSNESTNKISPIERLQADLVQYEPYFNYLIKEDRILVSKNNSFYAFITLDDKAVKKVRMLSDIMIFSLKNNYRTNDLLALIAMLQQFKKIT